MELKIRHIGSSLGVIFPKKMIKNLDVEAGDYIHITHSEPGFIVSSYGPDFVEAFKIGEELINKRNNILKALA
jgi:putative addiction module antidote